MIAKAKIPGLVSDMLEIFPDEEKISKLFTTWGEREDSTQGFKNFCGHALDFVSDIKRNNKADKMRRKLSQKKMKYLMAKAKKLGIDVDTLSIVRKLKKVELVDFIIHSK